jgi:phosphoribosylamine-glycine ligase
LDSAGNSVTNGGRVFNVIAMASSITLARQKVYNVISAGVGAFEGSFFRRDIAEREESL